MQHKRLYIEKVPIFRTVVVHTELILGLFVLLGNDTPAEPDLSDDPYADYLGPRPDSAE